MTGIDAGEVGDAEGSSGVSWGARLLHLDLQRLPSKTSSRSSAGEALSFLVTGAASSHPLLPSLLPPPAAPAAAAPPHDDASASCRGGKHKEKRLEKTLENNIKNIRKKTLENTIKNNYKKH